MILRVHLMPALGHKRLDAIKSEDVQRLKSAAGGEVAEDGQQHADRAERAAEEGGRVGRHRADAVHGEAAAGRRRARRRSTTSTSTNGSSRPRGAIDPRTHLIVLLGGEAGLRCGEMIALEWSDVDLVEPAALRPPVRLERPGDDAEGRAAATRAADATTDGGARASIGTCGARACSARTTARRSRGRSCRPREAGGTAGERQRRACTSCVTRSVRTWRCVARRRGRFRSSPGTADLTMTQRYMHLSPAALDAAIRLLGSAPSGGSQVVETFWRRGAVAEKRSMNTGTKLAVRQGFEPWVEL